MADISLCHRSGFSNNNEKGEYVYRKSLSSSIPLYKLLGCSENSNKPYDVFEGLIKELNYRSALESHHNRK